MTLLWLPKYRDIIVPVRSVRPGVRGRYKLEARRPDGRMRPLADWFPNLVTNSGLDVFAGTFSNAAFFSGCVVGTGNVAPANTDTALQTQVARTTTKQSSTTAAQSTPPYYGSATVTWSFAQGAATGNLSEVGCGQNATPLFSRALILDGGGSPTTITVLSDESLFVTYQLQQVVPTADVTGTVNIGGTDYDYTLRAANATAQGNWAPSDQDVGVAANLWLVSNGTISAVTGSITGTTAAASSIVGDAYVTGSYSSSATATWALGSGNLSGGITAAQFNFGASHFSRGLYQVGITPAIPKDASHVLTLKFGIQWARA